VNGQADYDQRWYEHRQGWAAPGGSRFDPRRYGVAHVTEAAAREFIQAHHYLGSSGWPAVTRRRYGLFDITGRAGPAAVLAGVALMTIPVNKLVVTNPFPHLEAYEETLELGRFALLDCGRQAAGEPDFGVPRNGESWFLAEVRRLAGDDGLRGVVMFSDPHPRWRLDGRGRRETYMPGHVGTIYQASGCRYLGQTDPQPQWVMPSGAVIGRRTLQKIRGREKGWRYATALLIEHGAPELVPGDDPREYLQRARQVTHAVTAQHPGYHKYAVAVGTKRDRRAVQIALSARPYPKKDRNRQLGLFGDAR